MLAVCFQWDRRWISTGHSRVLNLGRRLASNAYSLNLGYGNASSGSEGEAGKTADTWDTMLDCGRWIASRLHAIEPEGRVLHFRKVFKTQRPSPSVTRPSGVSNVAIRRPRSWSSRSWLEEKISSPQNSICWPLPSGLNPIHRSARFI